MTNNYVKIRGNLGADPEFRSTQEGKDLATLRVAVSERYLDKEDNVWKDSEPQWFNAVAFKPLEVSEARHLKKGSLVNIEGKLKTKKYTDNEGKDRYATEIVISALEEIIRRKAEGQEAA